MTIPCSQCGASLRESAAFCTECGAPHENTAVSATARGYCTKCGSPFAPETKFCTKCGAPPGISQHTASGSASEPGELGLADVADSPIRAAGSNVAPVNKVAAPIAKVAIFAVIVIALLTVTIVGGFIYAVHRARQKAAAIKAEYNINKSVADLTAAATAAAQNAEKQAAAIPLNATPGAPNASSSDPTPPASAKAVPIAPAPATGDQVKDWALPYERTANGPEADLVVRTGYIDNFGLGWPKGFDPFSGQATPPHRFPWTPPAGAPDGTDRILIGSAVTPTDQQMRSSDGYSRIIGDYDCLTGRNAPTCKAGHDSLPQPIKLPVGALPGKIDAVLFQMFLDDFQAPSFHSYFQISLNGTRIPSFEDAVNALDQTGPIGKLVSLRLLPEYWPLLQSGTLELLIDDPTTHAPDGYAIDFVRILVNPHEFKYQVSLAASVVDADKHTPIPDATVTAALESAATDRLGKCALNGLPAGLVVASASAPGYDESSQPVDLVAGQTGTAELQLHRHEENTAALERAIAQTGSATIYGIHFDTGSAKLRPDSAPALAAILGLIKNHPGSRWIIAGHTDNQGGADSNQWLSTARAASVVTWLSARGVAMDQLVPQGFGASRPVADNATANGRALNRRVEIASAPKQ